MAFAPESARQRVPPESVYWNILAQRPSMIPPMNPELAAIQGSRELRNIERQLQGVRSAAERALAASRALDPRYAPLVSDIAMTLHEAQQAELRLQSTRSLLESTAGLAPSPEEAFPQAAVFGVPSMREIQATAAWTAAALRTAREPPMEIRDTGKELVVHLELPGVSKDDVEVQARDTSLYVCAEHEREAALREQIVTTERPIARFERRIVLPEHVVPNKASATFRDGILEVTLPKKHPGEPPQRLSIR